ADLHSLRARPDPGPALPLLLPARPRPRRQGPPIGGGLSAPHPVPPREWGEGTQRQERENYAEDDSVKPVPALPLPACGERAGVRGRRQHTGASQTAALRSELKESET